MYRIADLRVMAMSGLLLCGVINTTRATSADSPPYACNSAHANSVETLICADAELSQLDRQLADIYAKATTIAMSERASTLAVEQRTWIKGLDECWKSASPRTCVRQSYRLRMAELQARYRLVASNGTITYFCNGVPRSEVVVTYFATDPPTLIAKHGDTVSLMYREASDTKYQGRKYQGRNESLWQRGDEAGVTWGYGTPEMRCKTSRQK